MSESCFLFVPEEDGFLNFRDGNVYGADEAERRRGGETRLVSASAEKT